MSHLSRRPLGLLTLLALLGSAVACASTGRRSGTASADDEVREAVRLYDDALRRRDVATVERFWADEYTFVNPRGELLTREARLANLRTARTSFDTLTSQPRAERLRVYGDVVVHTTLLTIGGRYGGQAHEGSYRALVIWARKDGQWQQVASQLTAVAAP